VDESVGRSLIMWRFFVLWATSLVGFVAHSLFVLPLFQQLKLPPQRQDLLLLGSHGIIQGLHSIFLKRQLALQLHQIPSQLLNFFGHTLSPACLSAAG
jgi:hypothetical protein